MESIWLFFTRQKQFITPIVLSLVLLSSLMGSFLLFHTGAELFAIIVAFIMFVVAWQTYRFSRNYFLLFLGIAYFWVGALDLLHTISYGGIGILSQGGPNVASKYWLTARFLESLALLISPFFLSRHFNRDLLFVLGGIYFSGMTYLIVFGIFPDTYIQGKGLTTFKVASEYVFIVMIIMAGFYLWRRKGLIDRAIFRLMLLSLGFTIAAEVTFTLYTSVVGLTMVVGHILKFLSFWFIFVAIIRTTLTEPYDVMARGSSTYDALPNPIVVVDKDGIIHQGNRAAFASTTQRVKPMLGQHCHDVFHPKQILKRNCEICRHIQIGAALNQFEIEFPDVHRWYEVNLSPVSVGDRFTGMVHSVQDITLRQHALATLQESEEKFRQVADNIHAVLWMTDPVKEKILYTSPAYEEIWGRSLEHLKTHPQDFINGIHPDDRPGVVAAMGKQVHGEYDEQYRVLRPDGSIRWIRDRAFPIPDETGEVVRITGIAEDITQIVEAEDQRRASQAKSEFLARVSHELRTPMNAILGFAQLVDMDIEEDDSALKQNITEIISAGHHLISLINEIIDLSRIESGKLQLLVDAIDLRKLLQDCMNTLEFSASQKAITMTLDMPKGGLMISADSSRLRQAMLNLLSNAIKYNKQGGLVRLTVNEKDSNFLHLAVIDTGIGISQDQQRKLFVPFERVHSLSALEGSGIGLALTRKLIHLMGGEMGVSSRPNEGSTFWFTLPQKATGI